ncbi:glycerophosphodiester phosphodiesterase family protein [Pseudonocardia oroxyli]|uniref:Glycerophosphoryl diester phosphodiesterase n=1 Tax=Pseudonocardia oroxyli TaxID=366584 RepID=A0A1G7DG87_PSEOR|nr:glycerophosphodiester phosphodiesterase family protein [Pseudonocardia oroxyli]SDE50030.1 glycerophosphoryl diester phosphodiesterase [Pseudonocardia oroxyli]
MSDHHPYLDGPHPRIYAHRGWHVGELAGLENTLAGFAHAVERGYAYLELDVHASADGVPMVHHDHTLDRTTDASGPLVARQADELAEVRVGGREPVPRLETVLAALPDTRVTIELKSDDVVAPTLAVLERLDAWDRVCLGSASDARLRRARAAGPRLLTSMGTGSVFGLRTWAWTGRRLLPIAGGLAQLPHRVGPLTVTDAAVLRRARELGVEVHVWTVNDPAEMRALLDLGVDGLLTDRPDLLIDL